LDARNLVPHDFPHKLVVNTEVIVDQAISHPGDGSLYERQTRRGYNRETLALDKEINVAHGFLLIAHNGAKKPQPLYPQGLQTSAGAAGNIYKLEIIFYNVRMVETEVRRLVVDRLKTFPAVALFGSRQTGKATLARTFSGACYDLEIEEERLKIDIQWADLIKARKLLILDEAQNYPGLFPRIRSAISGKYQEETGKEPQSLLA